MSKYYFISFSLLMVCSLAFSQDDFVVTAKGDTITGRVTFQQIGNIEQVLIKGDKRQTMSAIQVRMAISKGKVYRPVQYSGMVQMMQVITDGYLALLAFQPPGVMNYDGRLLMLRDGDVLEVPTIGFKKHVGNFLSANAELSAQIKDGDLDRKDLDEIIEQYNTFIEQRTATGVQQSKVDVKQKTRLEALDELLQEVKLSDIESKNETVEMLTELKDKIENQKPIPQYLSNALKENLKSKSDLLEKLDGLLKE